MALGGPFPGVRSGNAPAGALGIKIDIIPTPVFMVGQFQGLAISIRSYREPLTRAIDKVIIPSIGKNFTKQGRPMRWAPLAPFTKDVREYTGYNRNRPILVRSGKLKRAAMARARWTITRDRAYVGNNWPRTVQYGPILQNGWMGRVHAKNVTTMKVTGEGPPRPFMLIQDEDNIKIDLQFQYWIYEKTKLAGL